MTPEHYPSCAVRVLPGCVSLGPGRLIDELGFNDESLCVSSKERRETKDKEESGGHKDREEDESASFFFLG